MLAELRAGGQGLLFPTLDLTLKILQPDLQTGASALAFLNALLAVDLEHLDRAIDSFVNLLNRRVSFLKSAQQALSLGEQQRDFLP
jgi:hypothetical protein